MKYDLDNIIMFYLTSKKSRHLDMIGLELPKETAKSILYKDFDRIDYLAFKHNMFFIRGDNAYQMRCTLNDFKHIMNFYALSEADYDAAGKEMSSIYRGRIYTQLHERSTFESLLKMAKTMFYGGPVIKALEFDAPDIFGGQSYSSNMWKGSFENFDLVKIKDYRTFMSPVYELPLLALPQTVKDEAYSF